ncbi:hypothetical protein BDV59DRAFT_166613 [Aspergillus ambiguus]|uniref:uncharacterized protein n=1 Tax=Aspergillus ambiguus TaxID=176160 RepID=UPI003CCD8612
MGIVVGHFAFLGVVAAPALVPVPDLQTAFEARSVRCENLRVDAHWIVLPERPLASVSGLVHRELPVFLICCHRAVTVP